MVVLGVIFLRRKDLSIITVFSAAESYFSEILKGYGTCGKSSRIKEQRELKVRFKRRVSLV